MIPISPLSINHYVQVHQLQTFIFRKDCYATWAISVFLQASVPRWFGRHIIVEWQGTLVLRGQWQFCKSIFIGPNSDKTSTNISNHALLAPSQNQLLKSKGCTLPFPLQIGHGNPSPWITCQDYLQLSMVMTVCLWSWIASLRCPLW